MSLGSAVCGGEASNRRALQVCSEPSPEPEGWPGTVAIQGTEVEGKGGSRAWLLWRVPTQPTLKPSCPLENLQELANRHMLPGCQDASAPAPGLSLSDISAQHRKMPQHALLALHCVSGTCAACRWHQAEPFFAQPAFPWAPAAPLCV